MLICLLFGLVATMENVGGMNLSDALLTLGPFGAL